MRMCVLEKKKDQDDKDGLKRVGTFDGWRHYRKKQLMNNFNLDSN
jgi:hypothetical protein